MFSIRAYFFQFSPKKNPITFSYAVLFRRVAAVWICSGSELWTGFAWCQAQLVNAVEQPKVTFWVYLFFYFFYSHGLLETWAWSSVRWFKELLNYQKVRVRLCLQRAKLPLSHWEDWGSSMALIKRQCFFIYSLKKNPAFMLDFSSL